ncbi:MAG: hypothetical protein P4L46_05040 [Fimbriimonas sp.]|nr:hypothetical protein [Fimbriimonas sp.]
MKAIGTVLLVTAVALLACGCGESKADPAKDAELKASFSKKPDINTLSPGMRTWVQGMIDASKKGKPVNGATPPPTGK